RVTVTLAPAESWRSTSWQIGSGETTCVNSPNVNGPGTQTNVVIRPNSTTTPTRITLPETGPTPAAVTVRLFSDDTCGTQSAIGTAAAAFAIRPVTQNPKFTPSCDTRLVLVLDESTSIAQTPGATAAVRNSARAFMNGLVGSGASAAVIEFSSQARTLNLA